MSRRVHTADDVLRHALTGATELVVTPGDRLTPLARDVANEHGLRIVVSDGFATAWSSWSARRGTLRAEHRIGWLGNEFGSRVQ